MPYPLEFFDIEITTEVPQGSEINFTVGGNFQPNDVRLIMMFITYTDNTGSMNINPPPNFSSFFAENKTAPNGVRFMVARALQEGDQDTLWGFTANETFSDFEMIAVTVRGFDLGTAMTVQGGGSINTTAGTITTSSLTIPGPGAALFWNAMSNVGAGGPPTGFTSLAATDNAGPNYDAQSTSGSTQLSGKTFSAAGSTGSVTIPYNKTAASGGFGGSLLIFVPQAPDVTVAVGTAAAVVGAANVVTPSVSSKVTFPVGTATAELDAAGQVFNPLQALRISEPILLPGSPVTGSVVRWSASTFAPGSSVVIETSIDGGTTWDIATNHMAVPRLEPGNTTVDKILSRVTFTRALATDPTPRLHSLEVQVACDSSVDEVVPLGTFVINECEMVETGGNSGGGGSSGGGDGVTGTGGGNTGGGLYIQLGGVDLSRSISRNTWNDAYYVPAGTNYGDAIREIIDNRLPGCTFNFASTEHVTPLLIFGTQQGNDPWADCQDLATAIGYEVFFDARGICTFQPIPDPTLGDPQWEVDDQANPTVVAVSRTLSDESTYNYVVAQGESTGTVAPVSAVAQDLDPTSPTFVNGPYGTVSTYFTSGEITTQAQAQAAADAILRNVKGVSESVDLSMVPNPALEPGDVMAVNVGNTKVSGQYLINQVTTPLSAAEAQTLSCFRQK